MEKNVCKTKEIRVLGEIDISTLIALLPALRNEWDKNSEVNPNKMYSLKQVNHVNFRWSDKKSESVKYYDLPLWEKYKSVLLPIMIKAVTDIGYKSGYFPRVMLAKMDPNTVIPEHIDGDKKCWIPHKIHIPILTNPDVIFSINGNPYHLQKGIAYEVNNAGKHGVKNTGKSIRIHLIFEYLDAELNEINHPDF